MPRSDYEERRQRRIDRLRDRADNARAQSDSNYKQARAMSSAIPFGQPILVGHHSEGRDRRYRARFGAKYDKAFELADKANELSGRAEAAERNQAIRSDDPEQIVKLREKLASLEARQELMKKINAAHKKFLKKPASLESSGLSEKLQNTIRNFVPASSWNPHPFAGYELTNNGANIRRVQKQLEQAQAEAERSQETVEVEHHGFRYVENAELNRVQLIFPGKPSEEVRKLLRRSGFIWARSEGAWQRLLNNAGRWAGKELALELGKRPEFQAPERTGEELEREAAAPEFTGEGGPEFSAEEEEAVAKLEQVELAVERALTEEQKAGILSNFYRVNPHVRGAQVADVLSILNDYDSDLGALEPFFEANADRLDSRPENALQDALLWSTAFRALLWSTMAVPDIDAVEQLVQSSSQQGEPYRLPETVTHVPIAVNPATGEVRVGEPTVEELIPPDAPVRQGERTQTMEEWERSLERERPTAEAGRTRSLLERERRAQAASRILGISEKDGRRFVDEVANVEELAEPGRTEQAALEAHEEDRMALESIEAAEELEPKLEEEHADELAHELGACGGDCPSCQAERRERRDELEPADVSAAAALCESELESMVDEVVPKEGGGDD